METEHFSASNEEVIDSEKIKEKKNHEKKSGMMVIGVIILLSLCALIGVIGVLGRIFLGDGFERKVVEILHFRVAAEESKYFVISGGVENEDYIYANQILVVQTETPLMITSVGEPTGLEQIHIQVPSGVAQITFDSVKINTSGIDHSYAVLVSEGGLHLSYTGSNEIISGDYRAGIQSDEFPLILTALNEDASLLASGGYGSAGIGSGHEKTAGSIVIEGGNITALGGNSGAGIGAGSGGYCESVHVTDALVTVSGGYGAAGIGGGNAGDQLQGNIGNIRIQNSTVTAFGGSSGAGIGGGFGGDAQKITIENSTVKSVSESFGAGIGGGNYGNGNHIYLNSSYITVIGGEYGAGIGGGFHCDGNEIVINESEISASGGKYGAGIGGGFLGSAVNIQILEDSCVYAWAGEQAAGIGSGNNTTVDGDNVTKAMARAESIVFKDSFIYAVGGDKGAGIGGGNLADAFGIEVNNCRVVSRGGPYGAGIGSGNYANAANLIFCRSEIDATAGIWAAGIGGGNGGSVDHIEIVDSSVNAVGGDDQKYPAAGGAGIGGGDSGSADHIQILGSTVSANSLGYGAGIGAGGRGGSLSQVMVSGSSIKAFGANPFGDGLYQNVNPLDQDGRELFLSVLELEERYSESVITKMDCYLDTGDFYEYDCTNVKADQDGLIYAYLPKGAEIVSISTPKDVFRVEESGTNHFLLVKDHSKKRDEWKDISVVYRIEDKEYQLTDKQAMEAAYETGTTISLPGMTKTDQMVTIEIYDENKELLAGKTVALLDGNADCRVKIESIEYRFSIRLMNCNASLDSLSYEIDGAVYQLSVAELACAAGNQGVQILLPKDASENGQVALNCKTKDEKATIVSEMNVEIKDGNGSALITVKAEDSNFTKNYLVFFRQ